MRIASDLDGPIRANQFADSRESLLLANRVRVPELNPFFANCAFRGLKIANRRFEAIRANRSHVMKIGVFLRIDSRESIHANRLDSRCESLHLRPANFSASFDGKILPVNFSALFLQGHAQNSCPKLSAFFSNFTFLNPNFSRR